jgi:uncharacterized protein
VSPEENTRLVRSAYEAFGRGDMAALAEVMADDIEWVNPGDSDDNPNAGTFKGKEAALGWFGGLASTRDYTTFEPREFIAQNDKVVSLVYAEATVRDTGRAFVNHEHTCGRSGMGSSPDSRSISTPQRRLLPTAWSSPARGTGGSYKALAWASIRECHLSVPANSDGNAAIGTLMRAVSRWWSLAPHASQWTPTCRRTSPSPRFGPM